MGKIRIYSKPAKAIVTLSENYRVYSAYKSGSATLRLTPDGDYDFSIYGDISETTAKRSSEHKRVEQNMTSKMLSMYEQAQNSYVAMHRNCKLHSVSSYSIQNNVKAQGAYEWKSFDIKKPTDAEIKEIVVSEVRNISHNPNAITITEGDFVNANFDTIKKQRLEAWNDIQKLFNDIEKAQADKTNASYKRIYDASVKAQQAIIDGEPIIIDDAFRTFPNTLSVPFMIEMDYKYDQKAKVVDVELELTENPALNMPMKKASLKAIGKISVRDKSQGDIQQDATYTSLSLMYYVACNVFNISPNIQTCRVALYTARKSDGICWIEFDRNKFGVLSLKSVDPLLDLMDWSNVSNLKLLKTTSRLEVIEKNKFDTQIQSQKALLF